VEQIVKTNMMVTMGSHVEKEKMPFLDAPIFRFVAAVAAHGGDEVFEQLASTALLELSVTAVKKANEMKETYLDGAMCLLEGITKNSGRGQTFIVEQQILEQAFELMESGETYPRVRAVHFIAIILENLAVGEDRVLKILNQR
jgi:hypothetical protein